MALVSIIIPTLNSSGSLHDLFTALKQQTVKEKELLIVDSSSTDTTVEIANSHDAKIITIPQNQFDHGGTRNLGASNAKGDILVYLTQDAIPTNAYALENLIRSLYQDDLVAATFGRQVPYDNASPFSSHLRLFNYPDTSHIRCLEDKDIYGFKTIFISNSFSAYRRSALEKIGGFKNNLIFGEDTHGAAKLLLAGYKIAYAADAMVYHSHNYTASQELKRYFDIGVFHSTENWIVKEFGKTKAEGRKYIKSEALYFIKNKKYMLLPTLILRNIVKYLGYNLGLKYTKIPRNLAMKISMNPKWWKNNS